MVVELLVDVGVVFWVIGAPLGISAGVRFWAGQAGFLGWAVWILGCF